MQCDKSFSLQFVAMSKDKKVNSGEPITHDNYIQQCNEINELKSSILKVSLLLCKEQKCDN